MIIVSPDKKYTLKLINFFTNLIEHYFSILKSKLQKLEG